MPGDAGRCGKLAPLGDCLEQFAFSRFGLPGHPCARADPGRGAAAARGRSASSGSKSRSQAIEAFDPREPARTRFGALTFRGGLVLKSLASRIRRPVRRCTSRPTAQHFLSVTDKGHWLRGRIVYRDGRPIAIADAEMAPILGPDGRPLNRRGWYDTEALAEDGGTLYVGIERVNQIVRFDYAKDGLRARGQPIAVPPGDEDAAAQPEHRMPGGRAQGRAARRHADRDLRARPRCRGNLWAF